MYCDLEDLLLSLYPQSLFINSKGNAITYSEQ